MAVNQVFSLALQGFFSTLQAHEASPLIRGIVSSLGQTTPASLLRPLTGLTDTQEQLTYLRSEEAGRLFGTLSEHWDEFHSGLRPNRRLSEVLKNLPARPSSSLFQDPMRTNEIRTYQERMLVNLARDLAAETSPWLGLASPMQTGKSYMTKFIIPLAESILGQDTQFLILSSARVITRQILEDLLGEFDENLVGRFDGLQKEPKRITVASIHTLHQAKHLADFPRDHKKLVILLDEAFCTQTPIVRKILTHFGVGQEAKECGRKVLKPKPGDAVLIGLSGTASGLEGYHPSGHLDLLTAIEQGWVRPMMGEQVFPDIPAQGMRSVAEQMIWWPPTVENARALVKIYERMIFEKYEKPMTYVPTIPHGELIMAQLQRRFGKRYSHFVHSELSPSRNEDSLQEWHEESGNLVSVRMLSHGFRAKGADAVFHTYQTSSAELFAQRTGRAWGVDEASKPLYVLEATWDRRERFSNLARLLGLVDYPQERLEAKPGLARTVACIRSRQGLEDGLAERIGSGLIDPYFKNVPVLEGWRGTFQKIVGRFDDISDLSRETGLAPAVLHGFALGALPTRKGDVLGLKGHLGGPKKSLQTWIKAWEDVVDEALVGMRRLPEGLEAKLIAWRQSDDELHETADGLNGILESHFHPTRRRRINVDDRKLRSSFEEAIRRVRKGGEPVSPTQVANLAHTIYCEGLGDAARPRLNTFHLRLFSRRQSDKEIIAMVEQSGIAQPMLKIDKSRLRKSFEEAVRKVERKKQTVTPSELAESAYTIYCRNLSETEKPGDGTFLRFIIGSSPDAEIAALLERTTAVAKRATIDKERLRKSFYLVLNRLRKQEQKRSLTEIAGLVHQNYSRGLSERESSNADSIYNFFAGSHPFPEFVEALERAAIVKYPVTLDYRRLRKSFREAIRQVKRGKEGVTLPELANLAREIYGQGLPQDQHPDPRTLRNLMSGKKADPDILAMLNRSRAILKRASFIDDERLRGSFQEAIDEIKRSGRTANHAEVTRRASELYGKDIPEKDRPSIDTIEHRTSGERADPEILALLEKSGAILKRTVVGIDDERLFSAAQESVRDLKAAGKTVNVTDFSRVTYKAYCRGLPSGKRPKEGTFKVLFITDRYEPRIGALIERSGVVVRQHRAPVDRLKFRQSIQTALQDVEKAGLVLTPPELADRAYAIYCVGLNEDEKPSSETFRGMMWGSNVDPFIDSLLKRSDAVRKRARVDEARLVESLREAVRNVEKSGQMVSLSSLARSAHAIYCKNLSKEERPALSTLWSWMVRDGGMPEIRRILDQSNFIRKA